MPKRIDLDGGDPQDEIEQALRQLTRRQRTADPEQEVERALQEVAEQQDHATGPSRGVRARRPWAAQTAWIGLVCTVVGLLVAFFFLLRPAPPPPPARTPEDAVRYFYNCLIEGKYETATEYFPKLQTQYGSAAQAAAELRARLSANPLVSIRSVGPAVLIEGTQQYHVPFETYKREGQPFTGEFLVGQGAPNSGFVIVEGGV